jgi:hypothetical protein
LPSTPGPSTPPIAYDDAYFFAGSNEFPPPAQPAEPTGLLANDVDYDFRGVGYDPASLQVKTDSIQLAVNFAGSLEIHADGSFIFTPAQGFQGWTSFNYQATDGMLTSEYATAHLYVKWVEVITNPPPPPPDLIANSDNYLYTSNENIWDNVLDNDQSAFKAILTRPPDYGRLLPFAPDGSFVFAPDQNISTPTMLSYTAWGSDARTATAALTFQVAPSEVTKVDFRKWVQGFPELEDNPATDATPGGGKRIFPDKVTPTDEHGEARRTVRVVVEVEPKVANVPITVIAVDVDDPSSNQPPVDDESKSTDNRLGGIQWLSTDYKTDMNGVAKLAMRIDGIQPGNNFRLFASTNLGVILGGGVQDDSPQCRIKFPSGSVILNDDPRVSPLLTVWRRLHVERDHMGPPGIFEPFSGVGSDQGPITGHDDVAPQGELPNPSIALMQTNYRPAYVEVFDDLGPWNFQFEAEFVHNLGTNEADHQAFFDAGDQVRDVRSETQFWVVQILAAYESAFAFDFDPPIGDRAVPAGQQPDRAHLGQSENHLVDVQYTDGPCFIFLETIRDRQAYRGPDKPPAEYIAADIPLVERTVLHESAHQFNMGHGWAPGDEGPLSKDNNFFGGAAENRFTPAQLNVIRFVIRPG